MILKKINKLRRQITAQSGKIRNTGARTETVPTKQAACKSKAPSNPQVANRVYILFLAQLKRNPVRLYVPLRNLTIVRARAELGVRHVPSWACSSFSRASPSFSIALLGHATTLDCRLDIFNDLDTISHEISTETVPPEFFLEQPDRLAFLDSKKTFHGTAVARISLARRNQVG